MAQLWGGRFTKETKDEVFRFNESLSFDKRLFEQDIEGSIAHVVMMEKQDILTLEEKDSIVKGLTQIKDEVLNDTLTFDGGYEDVHSFAEAKLIEKIGEADAGLLLENGGKIYRAQADLMGDGFQTQRRGEILADELLGLPDRAGLLADGMI